MVEALELLLMHLQGCCRCGVTGGLMSTERLHQLTWAAHTPNKWYKGCLIHKGCFSLTQLEVTGKTKASKHLCFAKKKKKNAYSVCVHSRLARHLQVGAWPVPAPTPPCLNTLCSVNILCTSLSWLTTRHKERHTYSMFLNDRQVWNIT